MWRLEGRIGDHVQGALGAHGQRVTQHGLAIRGTNGGDHDFIGLAALLDSQRFLDGDGIERVDAELYAVEHHA
jgi:hypothetical protein